MSLLGDTILEGLREDTSTPDNWNTTLVESLILDAIHELSIFSPLATETSGIALLPGVHVYLMAPPGYHVLGIRRVFFRDYKRSLDQTTLAALTRKDPQWLLTMGSPREFVILDFKKILFYPITADESGFLELDISVVPDTYDDTYGAVRTPREFEHRITAYVRAMLLAQLPGRIEEAIEEYQVFLKDLAGSSEALKKLNILTRDIVRSVINDG